MRNIFITYTDTMHLDILTFATIIISYVINLMILNDSGPLRELQWKLLADDWLCMLVTKVI